MSRLEPTHYASYDLSISIKKPRALVWKALTQETNDWWLPDFHMVGTGSVVTLTAEAGGQLVEKLEGGGSLLWFTVCMVDPGKSLHLVGQSFPEWGGPATTMLKLAIKDDADSCKLIISDAIVGRVTDSSLTSLRDGWLELFTKGLKAHCEAK